jgi:membrane protein implicated in regulation of membrane protease activity
MNWIWLLLIVIVVVLDIATSNVLFSWLGIGFLVAWIVSPFVVFGDQVIIAFTLGIILLLVGNRISRKYIRKNIQTTPILVDKIVGKVFEAEYEITKETKHKINGIYWTLVNDGPPIAAGEHFKVVEIANNKLMVKKEEN